MDRREAVAGIVDAILPEGQEARPPGDALAFANTRLPETPRAQSGIEPYTGLWGRDQIFHLLRRTTFGPSPADVLAFQTMSMDQAVTALLTLPSTVHDQPLSTDDRDFVPVGASWVYAAATDPSTTFNPSGVRTTSLKAWWMGLMLTQGASAFEKMVLFWHNHFVTARGTVGDPRTMWRYVDELRTHALGNWKVLTRRITTDGAMLRYLNGNSNTRTSPNENYARELQELFTIGKGPEVAPGDYTTYTEADVRAAARVLTGWQDDASLLVTPGVQASKFTSSRHDTANKQFSERYANRVITGGTDGSREVDELLDMIFAQDETARFLVRKLYRWFVYYVIDEQTEAAVIGPLAAILRANNYDVLPVLNTLFRSAHFYDPLNSGCMIKSPVDFAVGIPRIFGMGYPADLATRYRIFNYVVTQAAAMQQNLGDPPGVAGWPAQYQSPQYYQLWINSDTLPRRTSLSNALMRSGYTTGGFQYAADPLTFTLNLPEPGNPDRLIEESARLIFAVPLTNNQKAFLKQTLIPGLPDYEWTVEWNEYLADPGNTQKRNAVKGKLQTLYAFMLSMPEFQLQ